jgi:hypothetical protein
VTANWFANNHKFTVKDIPIWYKSINFGFKLGVSVIKIAKIARFFAKNFHQNVMFGRKSGKCLDKSKISFPTSHIKLPRVSKICWKTYKT